MRILAILILAFSVLAGPGPAEAAKSKGNPRYASVVMDADTGTIVSERYADKVLHPASLTKMMTLLLAFEALDRGDIRLTDRIPISQHAASMVPSKLDLAAGSSIKVEDAILAIVTKSANDIAAALAEYLGGTESRFALVMTQRAKDIGMTRTVFKNASGLHTPGQVTSARDMAKMARYILLRYPHYYKYFSTRQFTYRGKTYTNHNRLMQSYEGMDGFKTGYIAASGFNLVASAKRGERRLIGVVFGGRTAQSRNDHMASLLNQGFTKIQDIRIARAPVPAPKPAVATSAEPYTSLAALSADRGRSEIRVAQATLEEGAFGELIGEGDYDPAVSKRLETGLLAVAAHKGESLAPAAQSLADAAPAAGNAVRDASRAGSSGRWAVQIGAYASRAATDVALQRARASLPTELSAASPMIMPLRTAEGLLFRARLTGMSRSEALRACEHIKPCLTVAPY